MGGEVGSFILLLLLHNRAGDPSLPRSGLPVLPLLFFVRGNGMAGGVGYLPDGVSTVSTLLPVSQLGNGWATSS